MEKGQEIFIKAKDSDYLHDIVQKKDWGALIELASARNAFSDLILDFFKSDESKSALKEMTEEQILLLIDTAPVTVSNSILDRMESFCDTDSKFTNIAVKLMKGIYLHGGDLNKSSIVKCLPLNILRVILDSRIPQTEFHFGSSRQEFFMHILSTLSPNSKKDFSYRNLKERDCMNGVFIYIIDEGGTFPIGRREVFKELINSLRDCFTFIQTSSTFDYKSKYIRNFLIDPFIRLIVRGLLNKVYDYKNDKEIIELLRSVFDEHYGSNYFYACAHESILSNNGNKSILKEAESLEECKVISPHYYYKVFKKAVEDNKENFIDKITRFFFTRCRKMHFIRELNDGVYDKLFKATIDMTVRELIERKQSDNFESCCHMLSYRQNQVFNNSYSPRFDECVTFIKSVISKIFDKAPTLNVDVTAYPEICCYLLNQLNEKQINLPITRKSNDYNEYLLGQIRQFSRTNLDLLDVEMRNNLVLGIIRHPTDNKKFSHIITSNNPTTLVNFICQLHSVQDIKLILPEAKRNSIDKYGFREAKSASNPKESCKMNLVEVFLQTLRFWENNDKSLFQDGYFSYYQFARKILKESIIIHFQMR